MVNTHDFLRTLYQVTARKVLGQRTSCILFSVQRSTGKSDRYEVVPPRSLETLLALGRLFQAVPSGFQRFGDVLRGRSIDGLRGRRRWPRVWGR